VKLVGVESSADLHEGLVKLQREFTAQGIYTTCTVLDGGNYARGALVAMDAMRGAFFPPNMVVVDATRHSQKDIQAILDHCRTLSLGLAVYLPPPHQGALRAEKISVWLSERSPHWRLKLHHNSNLDLPLLLAYLLVKTTHGSLRIRTVLPEGVDPQQAMGFLGRVIDRGRLPVGSSREVLSGDFQEALREAVHADLNVLGLAHRINLGWLRDIRDASGGACLFLLDSGRESLLA
jgi:hypothetical protein